MLSIVYFNFHKEIRPWLTQPKKRAYAFALYEPSFIYTMPGILYNCWCKCNLNCISKVPNATTSNVNSAVFGKHEVLAEHTWANFFSDANDNVHENANENYECYEK